MLPIHSRFNARLGAALVAFALVGCAGLSGVVPSDQWPAQLESALPTDVLLLGEQHDAPDHQRLQRDTVQWLAARGRLAAVVLEMAERGHSTAALARDATEAQVQSALRGDVPALQALQEISDTVDRATQLANQMLALAKVEQLRQQSAPPPNRFDDILRAVALDLSPLIAQRDLDFGIHTEPTTVAAHEWMLRERARNLLHNAIRHAPQGSDLAVDLRCADHQAVLCISDHGSGVDDELAARLFQPFSAGDVRTGSGLGLAICHEIVQALGGRIALTNRMESGRVAGLDAVVHLPLPPPTDGSLNTAATAQSSP